MDSQIEGYLLQLTTITQDLPGIAARLSERQFNWRAAPDKWSVGQCVEHLNVTAERYVPVLRKAILDARNAGWSAAGPFALGFVERWFLRSLEPPVRRRFKTSQAFVAASLLDPAAILERWSRLQGELGETISSAEGLDLRRIKVRSQFGPVTFSLFGTFAILLAHERRHLWQARQVRKEPGFPTE